MSGERSPEGIAKDVLGRIKGRPVVDLTRSVDLVFQRSIFEDDYYIDDLHYNDIGRAAYYSNSSGEGTGGMLFACPGCGRVSSIAFKQTPDDKGWEWNGSRESPTCLPSIVHDKSKDGCGWHGFLTDGRMSPV